MTFQEKIKTKRLALGLTQLALAEKLGYKTSAIISKAENGTRRLTPEEIARYAAALETTPEDLADDEPAEQAQPAPVQEKQTASAPDINVEGPDIEEPTPTYQAPTYHAQTVIKRKASALSVVTFILVLALLIGCAGGFVYFNNKLSTTQAGTTVVVEKNETPTHDYTSNTDGTLDTAALLEKVLPTVCYIEITTDSKTGSGSGVFLTEDGWIVTCAHVISSCTEASQITVMTDDNATYTATEFHYDTSSDIGVVKIEGTFTAAEFGDSSKVVAGETVVAVGSPLSKQFFQTATQGICSNVRHNFEFSSLGMILNVIQHDAAINSGNSGGPLFNAYGQVIGINSIKMSSSYENIAFAITSNDAYRYAKDLIQYGKVNRPMIGITGSSSIYGGGVTVAALTEGGLAEVAGVQVGDVITAVDGYTVDTISQLISYLTQNGEEGKSVTLTITRNGQTLEIPVELKMSIDLDY